ncbi:hypothetical protein NBRC10512_005520 [Rhodotorula toruloides]|uniref:RHTO0S09e03576g1_1 n=2 Tax=Rhodotorula toruloides TaxID=5286 RepID=A0A061B376_RHOTO|nr:uncharacterized protein RHTO_07774 [Rhodotorula toruloides NP11]EMS22904.1 hypothetical protein RHTO_07774 [Rhodotorula toruloides NP11]CDR44397.1 RHTO0S09e03576g1_1 [Rhodotorula toruloides]
MSTAGYDSAGTSAGPSTTKRRRVNADPDFFPGTAPTTKRLQAKAQLAASQNAQLQQLQQQENMQQPRQPIISLASLPPEALQRYLSRYGLLEPQGSLSYYHAVFPVPPLPATLYPPLDGRTLNFRRAKQTYIPAVMNAKIAAAVAAAAGGEGGAVPETGTTTDGTDPSSSAADSTPAARGTKRPWIEPKTPEFAGLSAFDDPQKLIDRLAAKATAHWDKRDSLKEGETLTNFMFSVRNRDRKLRATPAG